MSESERKPMRGYEVRQLQMLAGLVGEMTRTLDNKALMTRLALVGKDRRMKAIVSEISGILGMVYETIPVDKLLTLKANFEQLGVTVSIIAPVATEHYSDRCVIFSDVLDDLIMAACKNECLLCEGAGNEMAICKFRKALKQVVMDDGEDVTGLCVGRAILSRKE